MPPSRKLKIMSLHSLRKEIDPFIRYCVIGVLVTLIDLFTVYVLREFVQTKLLWAVFWALPDLTSSPPTTTDP